MGKRLCIHKMGKRGSLLYRLPHFKCSLEDVSYTSLFQNRGSLCRYFIMAIEGRKGWYRDFIILPSKGFVSEKCPRNLYPKSVCRERLGESNNQGRFKWRHCFELQYQKYIAELFERTHQS
ncbi:hypothetical protein KC19_VG110500 [Ceratodon purpureus]|uniref:Uncharacterized protein n=1 Tax=Ceratodon purpureus TaxID=3225 RepID=A0A8T0HPD2_CERPU|nr:hypothetical protein KC19_VG110500 [Ceratodon purpureus]